MLLLDILLVIFFDGILQGLTPGRCTLMVDIRLRTGHVILVDGRGRGRE